MKITVIGTGYVGLVTGTGLAEAGNDVVCVDINEEKVRKLNNGEIPIYEPGLDVLVDRNRRAGRLHFTTDTGKGIEHGEIIFLALPTPEDEDGSADLSYVKSVAEQIGDYLREHDVKDYKIVVNKSTVPVGTADEVRRIIREKAPEADVDVVSNPEFLREGFAVDDFMKPERVVIGTSSERAARKMEKLYQPFVRSGNPILIMDEKSAEITKYAANAFLAMKISFMNEIANFCERVGADVDKVRIGMGTDSRIGMRFLFPGIGYGGSCFPKDVKALYKTGQEYGYDFKILKSVMEVNERQRKALVPKMLRFFDGDLKDKKIAVWGLSFKPETDDIREAPSLYIIEELLKHGAQITAYDPEAMENVKRRLGDKIAYASNPYEALKDADALLISTEWNAFRSPDFERMKKLMKQPVVFDGRNIYDLDQMRKHGFVYYSIGRPQVNVTRKLWKEF
ncbi:MAG: UDP-glucose/GDP-mannose dehydrogenase family protein [Chlorobi bacterium]|nr:UDP-glucose/GDP-mannose dehydrogenase family protein [Chlorobiota bacterium]